MSRRLFESLRAVGLQHHYDRLSSVGVRSLAHLTVLTLDDFPLLGIRTMEDRTCLFRLVQQLRTLDPQTLLQAGAEEETSYPQRMHQTGAEEDSHSATPNSQQCDNKTWNDMSSVCRQLDFSSETASEPPTGNTEESFGNSAANNNFRKDCGKLKSLLEKQVIKNVMKDYTDMKPKQNSKKSSRRKPNKPTLDTENVRTLVYQSSPSECNYGLPQTRSLPTPSKRRSGEPRIWVCVRKRPLTPAEEKRQETDVVTSSGQSCVVQESRAAVDLTHYELQHKFYFDYVFGEDCSNEEVYQRTASPLVQHMLRGGSATCFAYGQTGAGKTHTMLGSSSAGCRGRCSGQGGTGSGEEPGLYALAAQDLFSYLSSSPTLSVFVSFFEIYCGQLYDLLDHRKRLFAREDGQRNVHIAGMCYRRVESVQSLLQVISRGTEERSQGCSGVNPVSSRSHALLQIQLRGAGPRGAESRGDSQSVHGRMWFVDLAGSERASDSRDSDRRSRMEGAEINQSLLALKECIRSLDQEQGHTPFRQSKLTQVGHWTFKVLKDSFVGDSLTCMIANVSPGHCSTEHTLNTLRYADRVKELKGQSGQHTARRSKNPPCPKQHLSQSNGASRGRYRGLSPPKKPRTTSIVPSTPSAIRMHEDSAFLCSTPKNHQHNQDSRGRCDWISPVQSRPRVRREESEYREAKLWNQASSQQQNHEFGPRKIENEPSQSQRSHKWNDLSRYFEDQEKRRHLKLYHQQLQQFDPLLTSSGLLCQNTSTNSPKANSHAMESMLTSSVAMEDILGRFEARINQVQPCVSSSEAGLWLNNRKSGNFKYLVDETGVILRENRTGNNRRTKNVENREVKCAWISENEDVSGNCLSLGDNIKNCTTRRGFPVEFCDPRAPAERPLSPAAENSNSLLTLSDLDCSKMIPNSPKHNQCNQRNEEQSSVNMDPLRLSMLEEGQELASVLYLQQKPTISKRNQEAAVPVCSMGWGLEEGAEESYLEVPQAIGSSMVPWAIRFHSQPKGGVIQSTAPTAQPISALNDVVFNKSSGLAPHNSPQIYNSNNVTSCPQSQNSTAPPLGHSRNSSSEVLQSKEERIGLNQSTCEEWTSGDHWLVVQAHLETLKQMERLSHREGTLLGQQPDMAFVEYVQQLEQIMRRKALCVRSLISHLQTYLKTSHSQP